MIREIEGISSSESVFFWPPQPQDRRFKQKLFHLRQGFLLNTAVLRLAAPRTPAVGAHYISKKMLTQFLSQVAASSALLRCLRQVPGLCEHILSLPQEGGRR